MSLEKLYNKIQPYLLISLITVASTLLLWLPFIMHQSLWLGLIIDNADFAYIYRHFDGLLYIIPAKTLYDIKKIDVPGTGFILELPLSAKYFAAHLPFYPVLIRLFAGIFGYLKSMLVVNLLATLGLVNFFYFLLKRFNLTEKPLSLLVIFLFLPRFFVVRSIGAPESLFILLMLLSLFFFEKKSYWLAGIFGGLSAMTKTPGILLLPVYCLVFIEEFYRTRIFNWQWFRILTIPLGLFAVFGLYHVQMNDFFAYFHTGGVVPMPYPYSVFNAKALWVGTAWLEEVVFYFFLFALTVVTLYKFKLRSFFYFSLVFFIAIIFIRHRDIARYSLPLWPMAAIAFEKAFTSKKFVLALLIILPAVYLYAWNFLSANVMPVSDWKVFL